MTEQDLMPLRRNRTGDLTADRYTEPAGSNLNIFSQTALGLSGLPFK